MEKKRFSDLVPGDVLWDMHHSLCHNADGTLKNLPIVEPVTIDDTVVMLLNTGSEFITDEVRKTVPDFVYTNKLLVVLQEENMYGQVVCAYSYDANKLCVLNLFNENLRVKENMRVMK